MIDPLMYKAAGRPFSEGDVDAACRYTGLTRGALFDAISRRVARGYASGELSFDFCDAVMNHMYSFMMLNYDMAPPDYSYSVFLAFDEGEYQHRDDPENSSSEDLYTKPMIPEILASDAQVA
jgi:hypothetical protein